MSDGNDDWGELLVDTEFSERWDDVSFDEDWTPPRHSNRPSYHAGQRCPVCGNIMELKTNQDTGHHFVGCAGYPMCSEAGRVAK